MGIHSPGQAAQARAIKTNCPTPGNLFSHDPGGDDTYEELTETQPNHQRFCALALVI